MKRILLVVAILAAFAPIVDWNAVAQSQDAAKATAVNATAVNTTSAATGNPASGTATAVTLAVIPAPVESRLKWENHRLRAANIRLQIEGFKAQAEAEDKAGDAVLDEMQKAVGGKYGPQISQAGVLEFALKKKPDTTTAEVPLDVKKP